MLTTPKHGLKKPVDSDDIILSINSLANNFDVIDNLLDESTNSLNTFLTTGVTYLRGKKVWNLSPTVSGNVGWVNLRDGKHAQTWQVGNAYSVGDLIMANGNNGHIYQCVEDGTSALAEPLFPSTTGAYIYDQRNAYSWTSNYVYNLNDIVVAVNGSQFYYYKCIQSGTSSTVEPTWSLSAGTIIDDGTAKWQTYKTVKWQEAGISCDFKQFGTIY